MRFEVPVFRNRWEMCELTVFPLIESVRAIFP